MSRQLFRDSPARISEFSTDVRPTQRAWQPTCTHLPLWPRPAPAPLSWPRRNLRPPRLRRHPHQCPGRPRRRQSYRRWAAAVEETPLGGPPAWLDRDKTRAEHVTTSDNSQSCRHCRHKRHISSPKIVWLQHSTKLRNVDWLRLWSGNKCLSCFLCSHGE